MRFVIAIAAAVVTSAGLVSSDARAANGTFTQHLCFNADTGQGTGAPPEVSITQLQLGYEYSTDCSGAVGPSKGLLFSSGLPTHTSDNQFAELRYASAPGVALLGGDLFRYWETPGIRPAFLGLRVHGDGTALSFGPYTAEYASWWQAEQGYSTWGSRGSDSWPFAAENRIPLSVGPLGTWRLAFWCDSAGNGGCDVPVGANSYRIFGGRILLKDDNAPDVSTATGELASAATLKGSADLSIRVKDIGAGVYRANVVIDGAVAHTTLADDNDGQCRDINPRNADPYEFGRSAPCRPATSIPLAVDTSKWKNGEHSVAVVVEDAAGNSTTALSRKVTSINANGTGVGRLTFSVGKRTLRNGRVLRYSGKAFGTDGSRPYVDVQVRSGRQWRPVCAARTTKTGSFSCRHRFTRTFSSTKYVFRARLRAQQATGERTIVSRTRAVVVRP